MLPNFRNLIEGIISGTLSVKLERLAFQYYSGTLSVPIFVIFFFGNPEIKKKTRQTKSGKLEILDKKSFSIRTPLKAIRTAIEGLKKATIKSIAHRKQAARSAT